MSFVKMVLIQYQITRTGSSKMQRNCYLPGTCHEQRLGSDIRIGVSEVTVTLPTTDILSILHNIRTTPVSTK
jgi:hypothetical protein